MPVEKEKEEQGSKLLINLISLTGRERARSGKEKAQKLVGAENHFLIPQAGRRKTETVHEGQSQGGRTDCF